MVAEVIVDVLNSEVDKIFEYIIPEDRCIKKGARVLLSFGNRTIEGYVMNIKETSTYPIEKLKPIGKVLDDFTISDELIDLTYYLKEKFHLRLVDGLRLVVPTQIRSGKVKNVIVKELTLNQDEDMVNEYMSLLRKNSIKPREIYAYMLDHGVVNYTTLSKLFGNPAVNKLMQDAILISKEKVVHRLNYDSHISIDKKVLTPLQQGVVDKFTETKESTTFLLHGVTGSGKTEVYLNIIDKVLSQGKTAIMLVPEISLTPQIVRIFTSRFGNNVAVLHSGLSQGEKYDEWCRLYSGEAKIAIGARSAIFAPLKDIGVIIIDEEHDGSYLSDSNPRYYTHDVANFRARHNGCNVILGSATPDLETYYKAKTDEYKLLEMPVRVNGKAMPTIEIVDMCSEFRSGNKTPFSARMLAELENTVSGNNQAILFINRRGFSSFLMCRDCGYIPKCEACDVSLVYHKEDNLLKCHFCGKKYRKLTGCPNCKSENIKLGGVGTQRVVEELRELFPNVPIFRMDNDTTQNKNSHAEILGNFANAKPGILVGTQMVAKGHDFPEVNLVGILDADLSLFFNDYKASEKTYALVTQVAGRAGRSKIEGKVVLQTYFPNHYVYKYSANYDYIGFYGKEINLRETTSYPPFSKVVRVLYTAEDDDLVKEVAHNSYMGFKELRTIYRENFYFLEAMKSPVTKIKNKFRYQVVMRFSNKVEKEVLDKIFSIVEKNHNKKVMVFVETNPASLS